MERCNGCSCTKTGLSKDVNDLRLVALTTVVMKILERFVKDLILRSTESLLDPMQFAYRPKRGVVDVTVTLLHLLIRHLEGNGLFGELYLLSSLLPLIQFNLVS